MVDVDVTPTRKNVIFVCLDIIYIVILQYIFSLVLLFFIFHLFFIFIFFLFHYY